MEGALVTCVDDARSEAYSARALEPGFVGHPPNKGWFCGRHDAEAMELAATHTLPAIVAAMRSATSVGAQDPRLVAAVANRALETCDVCATSFDEKTAGRLAFKHTPEGLAWRQAELRGEVRGTSPDHAWFCARHVNPALSITQTHTRSEALAELMPAGRDPLEYDEMPPSANQDGAVFPMRMGFVPVVNDDLEGTSEHWLQIAPHPPKAVHAAVHSNRQRFGDALGVTELRNNGSANLANIDPADTRWAGDGTWVSSGFTPHLAGDVVVFVIRPLYRDGDRRGAISSEGLRVLIQKREQSLFELTVIPADPPTIALDGLVLLERVMVRQSPLLDGDLACAGRLSEVVADLLAGLAVEPPDALSLAPDLVGVDLGSGAVARRFFGRGSTVEWADVATPFDAILDTFLERLSDFVGVLGLAPEPTAVAKSAMEERTERRWNPMDGARPPHCPFDDTTTWGVASEGFAAEIDHRATHWSEESMSSQSASLLIRGAGGEVLVQLSALDGCDGSSVRLNLYRPTTADIVARIRSIFSC